MSFELEGQNFVVTGAARGIGLAISRRLTELGASVSGWDLDQDAMSGESLFHHRMRVDVSDEKSFRLEISKRMEGEITQQEKSRTKESIYETLLQSNDFKVPNATVK